MSEEQNGDELPTTVRRTTLIVHDMERSLTLYRDSLGLEVIYDELLEVGGQGLPTGLLDAAARLVFLRSASANIGLISYLDPRLPESTRTGPRQLRVGNSVLVLSTTNVEQVMDRVEAVPGVIVQQRNALDEYPSVGGGTLLVKGNSFFDPDGFFIELNEVLPGKIPTEPELSQ